MNPPIDLTRERAKRQNTFTIVPPSIPEAAYVAKAEHQMRRWLTENLDLPRTELVRILMDGIETVNALKGE